LRGVDGEIGQHAIGSRPLEGQQALEHHSLLIQPAVAGRGHEHGVLARHLVGEGRHLEGVLDASHDVQVRHTRLDHDHVGTFVDVHRHFAQGFIAVARVHLVDLLVAFAQIASRAHGIAKGPIKGTGVLRAVGHDAGMDVTG